MNLNNLADVCQMHGLPRNGILNAARFLGRAGLARVTNPAAVSGPTACVEITPEDALLVVLTYAATMAPAGTPAAVANLSELICEDSRIVARLGSNDFWAAMLRAFGTPGELHEVAIDLGPRAASISLTDGAVFHFRNPRRPRLRNMFTSRSVLPGGLFRVLAEATAIIPGQRNRPRAARMQWDHFLSGALAEVDPAGRAA